VPQDEPGGARAEVAAAVLEPIAQALRKKRRLIVSPDGPLALVAFEALPWRGARLGQRIDVSYAQSLSVYVQLARRPPAPRGPGRETLLAMGAPSFADAAAASPPAGQAPVAALRSLGGAQNRDPQAVRRAYDLLRMKWDPLPGALREIEGVRAMFRGATVYMGPQASEERLLELNDRGELARYRYLLFSTHGYLSPEVPSLSAIVLSQPGNDRADGYVTAAEWTGYRLDSDLVVLSACETGLGTDVAGEGIMGLPFALFAAGNRTTVMSLWKVPDQSAAAFMLSFFRRLHAGAAPAAALAQTKREFMRHARYSQPVHWAGFVVYGP
jgi:CHAT domain-containing protein